LFKYTIPQIEEEEIEKKEEPPLKHVERDEPKTENSIELEDLMREFSVVDSPRQPLPDTDHDSFGIF
jgi:hypothetical protein